MDLDGNIGAYAGDHLIDAVGDGLRHHEVDAWNLRKCIAHLVDARQEKGSYAVQWNGKDEKGNPVGSGIYFYRLAAGSLTISRKMVLVR